MNPEEALTEARLLLIEGKTKADIAALSQEWNLNGSHDIFLDELQTLSVASSDIGKSYNLTDAGNGEAIADMWKSRVRYVFEWRAWIIYREGRWALDTTGLMHRLAVETMRELYRGSSLISDKETRKKLASWYIGSESDKRILGALNAALTQPGISIKASHLDDRPWLLNVHNGTIDLKTCMLRPASPDDLLTQQIDVPYNPDAHSEEWNQFLCTIFKDNAELVDYIQRAIGYTLNGTQLERVLFFLYGLGKNGKSQLMIALRRVLGTYALEAKTELFMEKKFADKGPDEGQAALKGVRLLTATELRRGQSLDISLVKRMTGGEPIWVERKFQRGYNINPTHKLWLSGNHEPRIKDTTDSIWDRLKKIPFECRIPADKEIQGYGEKLASTYGEAILNWCVEGAKAWNERGLTNPPECVLLASQEYRASQDALHSFLESVEEIQGKYITGVDMYNAYTEQCKSDDTEPMGKKAFNEAMRERGFKDRRGHGNKPVWVGVTFIDQKVTNLASKVNNVTENTESSYVAGGSIETFQKNGNKSNQSNHSNPDQLPDCPKCGHNEWTYSPDGKYLICPCGYRLEMEKD